MTELALLAARAPAAGDGVELTMPPGGLVFVNVVVAVIMFGVAVDLDLGEVRRTLRRPLPPAIGLTAQFVLLPALSALVIVLLSPAPAIALGMLIVASAPGGTVSNVLTHLAGANTSLSIGMTAVSSFWAVVMTPLNLAFWGSRLDAVAPILQVVRLDPVQLLLGLVVALGLPVAAGIWVQVRWPTAARRLVRPLRVVAVVGLLLLVAGALLANRGHILTSVRGVAGAVAVHNAAALTLGYLAALAFRLPRRDRHAICLEVGIQNAALSLAIAATFFAAVGPVALVPAFWGIWHIVVGLVLARIWSGQPLLQVRTGS